MNSLPVLLTKKQRNSGWLWWAFQLLLLPLLLNEGNRFLAAPLSEAKLNFVFFCLNFAGITLILWSFLRISCGQGLRHIFRTLPLALNGFHFQLPLRHPAYIFYLQIRHLIIYAI